MPTRQPSPDSSTAARIRNNQRRSRARRRELVDELKAKVREYERQGVQATLEMRQVARKVALENSRLRALLASRGVTHQEVDRYLASYDHRAATGGLPALAPQTGEAGSPPAVSDMDDALNRASSTTSALDTLAVAADASLRQACCGPTTQCVPTDARLADAATSDASPPGHGLASPLPATILNLHHPNTTTSHLEMSCTTAAHIMAGMYRHGSQELAREALGCSGPGECLVKNTLVLQLLDTAEGG